MCAYDEPFTLLSARASVRALAAELSLLSVFLGNDSGPRHVALAVGTPTVTLFGPEHPFEWHPYPEEKHPIFFIDQLACRKDGAPGMPAWCGIEVCVEQKHQCMTSIGVNSVVQALQRVARK